MIMILLYFLYYIFIGFFIYKMFERWGVEGNGNGRGFVIITIFLWPLALLSFLWGIFNNEEW